jgi:hypothetical protein
MSKKVLQSRAAASALQSDAPPPLPEDDEDEEGEALEEEEFFEDDDAQGEGESGVGSDEDDLASVCFFLCPSCYVRVSYVSLI